MLQQMLFLPFMLRHKRNLDSLIDVKCSSVLKRVETAHVLCVIASANDAI